MTIVYVLLYIHADKPEYSDVLGVYKSKRKAVSELLERANYRERSDGQLTQYLVPTTEYNSYGVLFDKVYDTMQLHDVDTYRIVEQHIF